MQQPIKSKPVEKIAERVEVEPDPLDPAVVLTFADLALIGQYLAKRITSQEELLGAIEASTRINVEGISIRLEPRLLMRLKTRCLDKPRWPSWLAETVKKQLHDYAGW
jgi:hypothetical protein